MSSIRSKRATAAIVAIALAGIIFPAGAFATPKPAAPTVVSASQAHPVMAIPGDFVNVTLKTGVTQVQILGP